MNTEWIAPNRGLGKAEDAVILLARLLLAALFLLFGWNKLMDISGTTAYMDQLGVPASELAAMAAAVIELGAGVALVLGLWTRPVAGLLAIYALVAALIGHPYWATEGAQQYADTVNFYKNLSIAGGCLLLLATGSGRHALDARRRPT